MDAYGKMNAAIVKAEQEEREWDEIDRMPMGQRMKSMIANNKRGAKASSSYLSTQGTAQLMKSSVDTVMKKEEEQCDSQDNPSNFSSLLMDDKICQGKVSSPLSDQLVHVKVRVKSGVGITCELTEDELDNMVLSKRMKLGRVVESSIETASSVSDCTPMPWRKTATGSVQAAMEEDAPELLQVLLEKGVSMDEMKLYGRNEPLDDLSSEDSFSELQAVISKLFSSQRKSLLKLAPLQRTKGEKASYCLACLFSLIEQARYLQSQKWPAEWGWCRDLQSFIFVFERHNRIVLERPEYGYATYFFELVDSSSIDWQIRRLVTAMKLTSYSRVTLIENRTLTVGKELSTGEARVLMSYGWVPNTGLGTMLKYCDRVIHDRTTEKDGFEWKSKIEKLLVAGYNGGSVVEKPVDHNVAQNFPEIKLELE